MVSVQWLECETPVREMVGDMDLIGCSGEDIDWPLARPQNEDSIYKNYITTLNIRKSFTYVVS